jgi:hypothetical protein
LDDLFKRKREDLKITAKDPARRGRNQSNEWPQKGTRGTKKKQDNTPRYFEWWFFETRRARSAGQAFRLSPENQWRAETENFSEKSHASRGQAEGLSYAPGSPGPPW